MSYSDNFPVLQQEHNWKKLIYLDAACTYLKSEPVIEAITQYYTDFSSCAWDRESSFLGGQVSEKIWSARKILRWFLGAETDDYIVFTKGTTDSINILSASISDAIDTYIVTDLEHNSNYLPWYEQAKKRNKKIRVIPYLALQNMTLLDEILSSIEWTFILSITHASNIIWGIFPIQKIANAVHTYKGLICVDDAQFVSFQKENVIENEIDFLAFSWHKVGWPTWIGVLYIAKRVESSIWISSKVWWGTVKRLVDWVPEYKWLPDILEWWVQDFAWIFWLAEAILEKERIWYQKISGHISELVQYFMRKFNEDSLFWDTFDILNQDETSLISLQPKWFHVVDFHQYCNSFFQDYIIIFRTGSMCADNFVNVYRNGDKNIMRFSFGIYNTFEEIDILFLALSQYLWFLKK